jgi:DNA repair exonuclease SbcCD ATPase subunit
MGDPFQHEERCVHRDAVCLCPVVQAKEARVSELETESRAYLERAAAWSKEWQAENQRAIIAERAAEAAEARASQAEAENAELRSKCARYKAALQELLDDDHDMAAERVARRALGEGKA